MRTMRETVLQLYQCISFQKGENPHLGHMREIFFGEGILINNNEDEPQTFTVDSFIHSYKENLAKGILVSLHAREISHHSDIFGKIAQCFSTYEIRFDDESPEPISAGINSVQLIQVEKNWLITSLVWCEQNERLRIPEQFLS
jgi:hypothetical protein